MRTFHSSRRPRVAIAAGIVAILALLALRAAWREAPREQASLAAPASAAITRPLPLVPSPRSGSAPATAAAVAPTARERVETALQSQDPEVRTEAYRLLRHCASVLAPGRLPPAVAPPPWMEWKSVRLAEQAWQSLAGRCASLRDLPDRDALQRQLDPVPAFASMQAQARWLAGTLGQHGGAALLWAGNALGAYVEERTDQPDGDVFETLDPEAIQIVRCRFAEECSAGSDAAHAACITLGACEGDVPQRLLATLGSRAARERVLRQADALERALARDDLSVYGLGR
ncbi:MAG TPA: hypothetical protein VF522_22890 [Ramlibacter sp.]|uniref:hypothetical protein n=1 Tax=Ramlibacter sp. TaxID=1917967 RepID=UPI002ED2964A